MELQEKTSQLIMRDIRNYEISVWTLQDDFITVLKHSNLENKGQIQNGEMTLNVDGTQELSFSIPLYYSVDGALVENPLWNLYKDGVLAANLKKLKVIMNKGTPDVEIYEFMILRVTERHEKNELYCDVECEGLAFQELGKQGYKISLSSDDFFAEDLEWFQKGTWKDYNGNSHNSQPVATLQYWCDKFLQPYPGISASLNPKIWYYQVQMDWSSFSKINSVNRDSSKVYEEEFIGNWTVNNDTLEPGEIVDAKEKARLVDFEESNIYNLTQDLAETFGVYCKYIFNHDDQYHITGRRIVFYNNFIEEQAGAQDITYKYNTTSISRTLDSTDLVTKMYVRPVDDDLSPSGLITIMDVDANKSKEDYLLNFDYLHDIGAIDDILYNEIPTYEAQMREINTQIVPLSERLIALQDRLPKAEAKLTTATNAIQLDKERISAASSLLNNLTGGTGRIEVTENNPDTAILMQSKSGSDSFASYYIKISKQGVIPDTLRIYRNLNFGYVAEEGSGEGRLTEEITTGQLEYDEFGNLAKVINLYKGNSDSRVVYLTYAYSPKLYYERVINTWTRRLALDTANQAIYSAEVMTLTSGINILQEQYNTLLATKAQKIKDFELLMGPALREGYWQPDDYIDYGDNYVDSFSTNVANPNTVSTGNSDYTSFIWDLEPFEDEQLIYEKITAGMSNWYYPTIDLYNSLTNATIRNKIVNNLDNLSFLYYDNQGAYNSHDLRQRKSLSLGSGCQLGFVKSDVNGIHPILILNGAINELDKNSEFQCYGPALGILTPSYTSGDTQITVEEEIFTSSLTVAMMPYTKVVYPRIQINSLNVKTSEDQLSIKINNHLIKNYEDFYILYKQTSDTNSISKLKNTYITLKPETLIKNGLFATNPFPCEIKFSLSNADTAIYLDAMQVLKDSSVPQVSYDLKVGLMQRDFIRNIHRMLNRIVHINDYELRFDHVRGYVSEVVLDLDHPWEDTIEVKNYTTKFEDLFAKIVASTEAMKKTQYLNGLISGAFTQDGYLSSNTVRSSLRRVDLNYAFNNGTLTIDEKNGIWGVSDAGVVAFRGGGIFTATEKDSSGNWIWNTGIVPQGINADLIVSGQLDTNRIRIYAGDRIRFQLNGDGLFAYKSFLEDFGIIEGSDAPAWAQLARSVDPQYIDDYGHYLLTDDPYAELDPAQYVVLNDNGLFLRVENGAYVLNSDCTEYIQIGTSTIQVPDSSRPIYSQDDNQTITGYQTITKLSRPTDRVEVSWRGLVLRNYANEETFFADPDTGNLYIAGTIFANEFFIKNSRGGNDSPVLFSDYLSNFFNAEFEDHVKVSESLAQIFDEAGEILDAAANSLTNLDNLTIENTTILGEFLEKAKDLQPTVYTGATKPTDFKPGDIWEPASGTYAGNKYLAMSFSDNSESSLNTKNATPGWNKIYDGSLSSIVGAGMTVDAAAGTMDLYAGSKMTLRAKSQLDLASGDIQITGNNSINIGSKWINIGATSGINIINSSITENDTATDSNGKANGTGVISKVAIDTNGIVMHSNKIELMAADSDSVAALKLDPATGVYIGSNKELRFFSSTMPTSGNSGASVLINPSKILFGVSSTGNATVVEMEKDFIILTTGAQLTAVENATDSTWTAANASISGVKITKDSIWMATGSGTDRGLITLTPTNLTLGVATSDKTGSFIKLSKDEFILGSSSNMYINANNIALDTTSQLSATGYSNVAFRLGSSTSPSLVLANNTLMVAGEVRATSGYFGLNNSVGWRILPYKEDNTPYGTGIYSIYNSSGEAVSMSSPGAFIASNVSGMYLWTGLARGTGFGPGAEICMYNGRSANNTPFFRVSSGWPEYSDAVKIGNEDVYIAYYPYGRLVLQNIELSGNIIQDIQAGVHTGIYTSSDKTAFTNNNLTAENGALGILYSTGGSTATDITVTGTRAMDIQNYGSAYEAITRFGLNGVKHWQIFKGAISGESSVSPTGYARAGCVEALQYNSAACVYIDANLIANNTYTITFNYKTALSGVQWDPMQSSYTRNGGGIRIRAYTAPKRSSTSDSTWGTSSYTLVGSTNFIPPFTNGNVNTTERNGQTTITLSNVPNSSQSLYLVFGSDTTKSLLYINVNSVTLSGGGNSQEYCLYVRSNGAWSAVTASNGGTTYTLPTATASTLGGIKVGSGLSISDGVLSVTNSGGSTPNQYLKTISLNTIGKTITFGTHDSSKSSPESSTVIRFGDNLSTSIDTTNGDFVIDAASGGGGTVSWAPILNTGTSIGILTVNGTGYTLYAPSGGGGGTTYSAGNGISISNNTIAARIDNSTIISNNGILSAVAVVGTATNSLRIETDTTLANLIFDTIEDDTYGNIYFDTEKIALQVINRNIVNGVRPQTSLIIADPTESGRSLWNLLQLNVITSTAGGNTYRLLHTGMKTSSAPEGSVAVTCYYNSSTGQFAFV